VRLRHQERVAANWCFVPSLGLMPSVQLVRLRSCGKTKKADKTYPERAYMSPTTFFISSARQKPLKAREAPATALPRRVELPNRFLCPLGEEVFCSKQTHRKSRPELYPRRAFLSLTAFFVSSATKNVSIFPCAAYLQSKPCHVGPIMLRLSRRSWWPQGRRNIPLVF